MAFGDARLRGRTEKRHPGPLRAILTVSSHIAVIALLLVALHALEAAL